MSHLKQKLEQENSTRIAGNMVVTLEQVDLQLVSDAKIITSLQSKVKLDVSQGRYVPSDMVSLSDALIRTEKNLARKVTYKAEFTKLKAIIEDSHIKTEIQEKIDKL